MEETLSKSIQDYLKLIYELTVDGEYASTSALAERLGISAPSVTGMLQKLCGLEPPLVVYQKYQGVKLTDAGKRAALGVIRHHRLIETWLVHSLGYSWDEVHEEAERLEHAVSEELEQRIAAALKNPVTDPHGEPIPGPDLVMPSDTSVSLASIVSQREVVMRRVQTKDADLLRHLKDLGLVPGARIRVVDFSPFDDNLVIKIGPNTSVLGRNITSRIFVE